MIKYWSMHFKYSETFFYTFILYIVFLQFTPKLQISAINLDISEPENYRYKTLFSYSSHDH
jgi:hypothetical protein